MGELNLIKYLNRGVTKKFSCIDSVRSASLRFDPNTFNKHFMITIRAKHRLHTTYEFELKYYISKLLDFTTDMTFMDSSVVIGYEIM